MVTVKIVKKNSFKVSGKKVFISGQDNSQFEKFWSKCNDDGTTEKLKSLSLKPNENVTGSKIFGVSRVEKDPNNRAFDFYIASECEDVEGFETFTIRETTWAIFKSDSTPMIKALIDAEMYAFMEWLPSSGYKHSFAPEL